MSSAVIDILFSVLSFLAFVLVFTPLPWHLKARNGGTCLFIFWIGLACLVLGVDSIIWMTPKGISSSIYTWCDISTKLLIGAMAAMPTVSLCINLRLYFISTDRAGILEKRQILITELVLGLGFPVLEMILHFIVQGHRFDIYGGLGCRPFLPNILLAYILLLAPQILASVASIILLVLTIMASREIYKKINLLHPGINDHEGSPLTFLWFLTLGGLTALASICYDGYWIYATLSSGPMKIWMPWNEMHNTFQVSTTTEDEWKSHWKLDLMLQLDRWVYVALGLLFFAFFGFTAEARRRYRTFIGLKPPVEDREELTDHELGRIMKSRGLRPGNAPLLISKPAEAFSSSRNTFLPAIDGRGSFFHADPDETFDSVKEKITKSTPTSGAFSNSHDVYSVASTSSPAIIYSSSHRRAFSSSASTTASSTPYASPNLSRSLALPSPSQPPNLPLPPVPTMSIETSSSHDSSSSYGNKTHSVYSTSNYSLSASSLSLVSSKLSTGHTRNPQVLVTRSRSMSATIARTYGLASADPSTSRIRQNQQPQHAHHRSTSILRRQHSIAQSAPTFEQPQPGLGPPGPSFLDMRNSQKDSGLFSDRMNVSNVDVNGVGMAF